MGIQQHPSDIQTHGEQVLAYSSVVPRASSLNYHYSSLIGKDLTRAEDREETQPSPPGIKDAGRGTDHMHSS